MYSIAIHGGAGTITKNSMTAEKEKAYSDALLNAISVGIKILQSGGSALDAVTATVVALEDCPLFNAGKGSVFTNDGTHEMDASIMNGKNRSCGAVAGIKNVRNPVLLSREVMEKTEHVFLSGIGAENFAKKMNLQFESDEYFFDEFRYNQWQEVKETETVQLDHVEKKFGTVGCVALDEQGNLAAATSTGGMTNKRFGRVGDTPIVGSGTWADNSTCAISCTGHGEYFIRYVVAYDIACLMDYKKLSLQEACDIVIKQKLVAAGGEGGLIAVDAKGNIVLCFNSEGMYRAHASSDTATVVEIYK